LRCRNPRATPRAATAAVEECHATAEVTGMGYINGKNVAAACDNSQSGAAARRFTRLRSVRKESVGIQSIL
jgi:hypothetical protein